RGLLKRDVRCVPTLNSLPSKFYSKCDVGCLLTSVRAFGRIGTAYQKQGDLANAVEYYQRSLTEHRTPDILTKLRAAEKAKIEAEKQAYIDPAKAEEAREQGNQYFKDANWVEAVKSYTEMIKRNPE